MYYNWQPKLMCYLWVLLANDSCAWPSFINHAHHISSERSLLMEGDDLN